MVRGRYSPTLLGMFGDEWLFGDRFGLFVLNAERFEFKT
ncbi:hypothetical protein SynPROSU1_00833 [Synechococcus sp. PROS-U-1]|nr:hypothetical protein SynPROSU1_00833 [Synechococcus sp. PROS-U-1]